MRSNPSHHHDPQGGDPSAAGDAGDGVAMVLDVLAPHARTVLAGVVAVLVAAAGWIIINSQTEAARGRSWDAYLAAMAAVASGEPADAAFQDVTQRHPGTAAADWSRLRMAEIRIAGGTEAAFRDRAAAARDFEAAATILSELLAMGRPRGLLAEEATFALAKARESLGDFDQARKGYETVVREYPQGPTAEAARRRAEALARGSVSEWYGWISTQDPVGAASDAASPDSAAVPIQPSADAPPASGTDQKSPDPKAADSKAPDSKAADSKAADSKAADTKAPDTKAPDTKAPDTKAPDTKALDSKASEKREEAVPADPGESSPEPDSTQPQP